MPRRPAPSIRYYFNAPLAKPTVEQNAVRSGRRGAGSTLCCRSHYSCDLRAPVAAIRSRNVHLFASANMLLSRSFVGA